MYSSEVRHNRLYFTSTCGNRTQQTDDVSWSKAAWQISAENLQKKSVIFWLINFDFMVFNGDVGEVAVCVSLKRRSGLKNEAFWLKFKTTSRNLYN